MNYTRFDLDRGLNDPELFAIPEGETYQPPRRPVLVIQGVGLAKLVFVRDGKIRYGLDGFGRRVYGRRVANWYGKRLLAEYRRSYCADLTPPKP